MPGGHPWVHPEAIGDARAAREWYYARNAETAEAFMAELDLAIERIEDAPRRWPPYLGDTRRYLLRRFPFFVVFREVENRVQILAVAHARRRPGYWLGR
ncbi:MAG TPA: type II toxin-antitoxin system RelE/ParE family toxin [Methylomirabilota bacterium]|nr:type II toxin-antitoxin system RelE/ParE family toxin [Methylomirabilota bacterium]